MKIHLILLLTSCVLTQPAAQPTAEKRLALVIGNNEYAHHTPLLKAVNDADDMAATLTQLGFEVLLHKNADKSAMQRAINEFQTKLPHYSVGLMYYAGHGTDVNGQHFMVPTDAKPTDAAGVEQMCLKTSQLITEMEAAKLKTNIIILDTDRTNPFERTLQRASTGSISDADAPIEFYIAYATSPGHPALEGTGRNGLYTAALLKSIVVPNMPIKGVFKQARMEVSKQSNNKQMPWELSSLTSSFYFLKK